MGKVLWEIDHTPSFYRNGYEGALWGIISKVVETSVYLTTNSMEIITEMCKKYLRYLLGYRARFYELCVPHIASSVCDTLYCAVVCTNKKKSQYGRTKPLNLPLTNLLFNFTQFTYRYRRNMRWPNTSPDFEKYDYQCQIQCSAGCLYVIRTTMHANRKTVLLRSCLLLYGVSDAVVHVTHLGGLYKKRF